MQSCDVPVTPLRPCPPPPPPGQQRSCRLLPQRVLHVAVLHAGRGPAPRSQAFLRQPAAAAAVVAPGREVADARRRGHDPAYVLALWSAPSHRHHSGGSWVVSPRWDQSVKWNASLGGFCLLKGPVCQMSNMLKYSLYSVFMVARLTALSGESAMGSCFLKICWCEAAPFNEQNLLFIDLVYIYINENCSQGSKT